MRQINMESITSSMDEFCVVLIVSFIYVLSIRLSLHHLSLITSAFSSIDHFPGSSSSFHHFSH